MAEHRPLEVGDRVTVTYLGDTCAAIVAELDGGRHTEPIHRLRVRTAEGDRLLAYREHEITRHPSRGAGHLGFSW